MAEGFFNNSISSVFQEYDCWCLTAQLGGVFPSPSPFLPRDFISGLGKMILYFRKDFQNLAADQKQNRAALHRTTPACISGINTKKCSTWHTRNFNIKISSKTDFVFAVVFDLDRATCSANTWLLDERRHRTGFAGVDTAFKAGSNKEQRRTSQNYTGTNFESQCPSNRGAS